MFCLDQIMRRVILMLSLFVILPLTGNFCLAQTEAMFSLLCEWEQFRNLTLLETGLDSLFTNGYTCISISIPWGPVPVFEEVTKTPKDNNFFCIEPVWGQFIEQSPRMDWSDTLCWDWFDKRIDKILAKGAEHGIDAKLHVRILTGLHLPRDIYNPAGLRDIYNPAGLEEGREDLFMDNTVPYRPDLLMWAPYRINEGNYSRRVFLAEDINLEEEWIHFPPQSNFTQEMRVKIATAWSFVLDHFKTKSYFDNTICWDAGLNMRMESEYHDGLLFKNPQYVDGGMLDVSEKSAQEFRDWLQRRYLTIGALNLAWAPLFNLIHSPHFTSFSEIFDALVFFLSLDNPSASVTFDQVKSIDFLTRRSLQARIDWMQFRSWQKKEIIDTLARLVHDYGGKFAVQTGYLWGDSAVRRTVFNMTAEFENVDWLQIADIPDWNHYFSMDLTRSIVDFWNWYDRNGNPQIFKPGDRKCTNENTWPTWKGMWTTFASESSLMDDYFEQAYISKELGAFAYVICNWQVGDFYENHGRAKFLKYVGRLFNQQPERSLAIGMPYQPRKALYIGTWAQYYKELQFDWFRDFYAYLSRQNTERLFILTDFMVLKGSSQLLDQFDGIYFPAMDSIMTDEVFQRFQDYSHREKFFFEGKEIGARTINNAPRDNSSLYTNYDPLINNFRDTWLFTKEDRALAGDFDGDGIDDLMKIIPNQQMEIKGSRVGWTSSFWLFNFDGGDRALIGDFNEDGCDDIMKVVGEKTLDPSDGIFKNKIEVKFSDKNGQFPDENFRLYFWWVVEPGDRTFVGDFDGDGYKDDFMKIPAENNNIELVISDYDANARGFILQNLSGEDSAGHWIFNENDSAYVGDFNGDGYTDIMKVHPMEEKWPFKSIEIKLNNQALRFPDETWSAKQDWQFNFEEGDQLLIGNFISNLIDWNWDGLKFVTKLIAADDVLKVPAANNNLEVLFARNIDLTDQSAKVILDSIVCISQDFPVEPEDLLLVGNFDGDDHRLDDLVRIKPPAGGNIIRRYTEKDRYQPFYIYDVSSKYLGVSAGGVDFGFGLQIKWTPPITDTLVTELLGYQVQYSIDKCYWFTLADKREIQHAWINHTNLTPMQKFYYRVRGVYKDQENFFGSFSNVDSGMVANYDPESRPVLQFATPEIFPNPWGHGIRLLWECPGAIGTTFRIEYSIDGLNWQVLTNAREMLYYRFEGKDFFYMNHHGEINFGGNQYNLPSGQRYFYRITNNGNGKISNIIWAEVEKYNFNIPHILLVESKKFPPPWGFGIHVEWVAPTQKPASYIIEYRDEISAWTPLDIDRKSEYEYRNHHGNLSHLNYSLCLESNKLFYYRMRNNEGDATWSNVLFNRVENWSIDKTNPATSVSGADDNAITSFYLYHNYPNPFNPETTIQFQIPAPAHVKVKIYNILGQEVATVVNNNMTAGLHKVIWNSLNQNGRQVSSGIYFYRIEAQTGSRKKFVKTKKMCLLH